MTNAITEMIVSSERSEPIQTVPSLRMNGMNLLSPGPAIVNVFQTRDYDSGMGRRMILAVAVGILVTNFYNHVPLYVLFNAASKVLTIKF